MANNWPDGGERPLSKTEKWVVGVIAVALIAGLLSYAAIVLLSILKIQVSKAVLLALGATALAIASVWVRPWNQEPPVSRPRFRAGTKEH